MGRRPANPVAMKFYQYVTLQRDQKELNNRLTALKKELDAFADSNGEADDKGHKFIAMPATDGTTKFLGFVRQRRTSQVFNEEKAEALLTEKGVSRELYISVEEYVDQDKIARLYADDFLTDEEFNSLIDESESFAFVPVKV